MYTQVASKLSVEKAVDAFSEAVSMNGANAVDFEYTVYNLTQPGTNSLLVTLQESNDLQNWALVESDSARTGIGYWHKKSTGIGGQYVRLKYAVTGGATSDQVVIGAGINTANL